MALIEVELLVERFSQFVQFVAATGPIPIGTVSALGPSRLIASFGWNQVTVGPAPPGFVVPSGALTARCDVTLRHVSTAQLDVDPNAAGSTTPATCYIVVTASAFELRVDLVRIEIAGAAPQTFSPGLLVVRRPHPPQLGFLAPVAATLLQRDGIVTLRFATRMGDSLQGTPLNLLPAGSEWAIRLSGEFFVEQLLDALQGALATPPPGATIEEPASASWGQQDGSWAAIGHVGLEKKNACPGLLEDVDISIGVDVVLTPSATVVEPPPPPSSLNLTLRLSSNVSDWDTFRCWLGLGGLGSSILGYIATPIVGPGAGGLGFLVGSISSLIAIAETVRLDAGHEITDTNVANFTPVSSSSTTATYTSTMGLPALVSTAPDGSRNGTIAAATTGPSGMLISGTLVVYQPLHKPTFVPSDTLTGVLQFSFDCGRFTWLREADIVPIEIQDPVEVLGTNIGRALVSVFPSSVVTPPHLWSVASPPPTFTQSVAILGSELVKANDAGRLYLHTSAGLRRYDIAPLADAKAPTQMDTVEAVSRCMRRVKAFTTIEELTWLVDPPPYDYGFPPLRQWLFTFGDLPAGTHLTIHRVRDGIRGDLALHLVADTAGEASFELVTDAAGQLVLEHNRAPSVQGRLLQRWLLPTTVVDVGRAGRGLARSGSTLIVLQRDGLVEYDVSRGTTRRRLGRLRVQRLEAGRLEIVEEIRRHIDGGTIGRAAALLDPARRGHDTSTNAPPFSLTLRDGKVAALFENTLVIGRPWHAPRVVRR